MTFDSLRFSGRVIRGAGRGRNLKVPTLNLDLRDVPPTMTEGLFAGWATIENERYPAVIHYGPRPTFGDTVSCEVHVIGASIAEPPEHVEVELVEFLREISTFPSAEALSKQMFEDIEKAKHILGV